MPLVLSNEDVTSLVSMSDCIAATEQAFLDLGRGEAVSRPRSELLLPQREAGRHYLLKTWDAALPRVGLAAIRITSNMMQRSGTGRAQRLDPLPLAGGDGFVGLVLLFDMRTLELQAIIQDARIQVMRAGATYGVAAKYLARKDADVVGLLGSGGQAREQLTAIALVRPLRRVKVFSPTRAHRERFAEEMSERLGIEIVACDDPRAVIEGADIVAAATSSLAPVLSGDWLAPGQHVTFAGPGKGDEAVARRASLIVLQSDEQTMRWLPANLPEATKGAALRRSERKGLDPQRVVLLSDIIAGRHPGRTDEEQITVFGGFNTFGPGISYAAVGAIVLERARQRGIGHALPAELFIQHESS